MTAETWSRKALRFPLPFLSWASALRVASCPLRTLKRLSAQVYGLNGQRVSMEVDSDAPVEPSEDAAPPTSCLQPPERPRRTHPAEPQKWRQYMAIILRHRVLG